MRHRFEIGIASPGVPVEVDMMLTVHGTVAMFMRDVHTGNDPVRQAAVRAANRRGTITGASRSVEMTA